MNYESLLLAALILAAAGMFALVILRSLGLGIAILIASGLLLPVELGTGTATTLNLPFVIAPMLIVVWFLTMAQRRVEKCWIRSSSTLPLLLLLLATILAMVLGQFGWFSAAPAPLRAQVGGACIILFSGGVFLVAAHVLRDLVWLKRITYVFLWAAALRILLTLLPPVPYISSSLATNAALGSLFWTWSLALGFALALFDRLMPLRWRAGLFALVGATLYIAFVQNRDWVSGWLPGCIALLVISFLRYPRRTVVVSLLLLMVLIAAHDASRGMLWSEDQQYSLSTRMEAAKVLAGMLRESPVFGFGPANYYHYTPLRPILGWYVRFSSHNNYLDILAQAGLFGLAALVWFLSSLGIIAARLQSQAPLGFPRAFVAGALGGLAGTVCAAALGDWLLPFVYNVGVRGLRTSLVAWVFLGGLVAIEQTCRVSRQGGGRHACRLAA